MKKDEEANDFEQVVDFASAFRYYKALSSISLPKLAKLADVNVEMVKNWNKGKVTKGPQRAEDIIKVAAKMSRVDWAATNMMLQYAGFQTLEKLHSSTTDNTIKELIASIPRTTAITKVESESPTQITSYAGEAQKEIQTANAVHNLFERWARDLDQLAGSDETSGFQGFRLSIESELNGIGGKDERFVLEARVTSPASESDPIYTNFQRGLSYQEQGKFELALAYYAEVLGHDDRHFHAHLNRAIIFTRLQKYDLARVEFDKAINIEPVNPRLYANKGYFYQCQKENSLALENYEQAIKLNPNYTDVYVERGFLYGVQGNYQLALADFTQAIELSPVDERAFHCRGMAYHALGNRTLALVDFTQAIELAPDSAITFYYRGMAYFVLENWTLALSDFNKAIELAPNFGDAYYYQAQIYIKEDKKDDYLASMSLATELGSELALQVPDYRNSPRNWAAVALGIKAMLEDEVLREREITILIRGKNIYDEEIYCYLKTPLKHYPIIKQMLENQEEFDIRDYGEVVEAGEGEPPEEVRERMKRDFDMVPMQ